MIEVLTKDSNYLDILEEQFTEVFTRSILFSFGITGKSPSSQVGNITRYLMPANMRATVSTPYAHLKTKKLHNFLFINPTNSIGDHRIKCTANAVLKIIVLSMFCSFFD